MNFIIHLPHRTDRYKSFKPQLDYFCGLDNYTIIHGEKKQYGCEEAFKKVIQTAKDLGLKSCTIFEDDIKILTENFHTKEPINPAFIWENAKRELPNNFDILHGGTYFWKNKQPYSQHLAILKDGRFTCMQMVHISERIFDTILNYTPSSTQPKIDCFLAGLCLNVFQSIPTIGLQQQGYSDNIDRDTDYNISRAKYFL